MQIYIHRDKEDFGPYSRETVLEYVKQGIFKASDFACYAGMAEWKTVSELLGLPPVPAEPPRKTSKLQEAAARTPSGQVQPPGAAGGQPARRRRLPASNAAQGEKKRPSIFMLLLNVVLIGIAAGAADIRWGHGGPIARHYLVVLSGIFAKLANENGEPSATPAPTAPPQLAGPAIKTEPAAVTEATPPPAVSTPPPAPKPFDIADLAGNRGAWPKMLRLKQAVDFPAVFNARVVGSVSVPAGSVVRLVEIQGDQLTLDYQGGTQILSWKLTDIDEEAARVAAVAAAPAAAPVAPPAAASAPVAAPAPVSTPAPEAVAGAASGPPDSDPNATQGATQPASDAGGAVSH